MAKQKQLDKNYIAVMGKIFSVVEFLIDKGPKQSPVAFPTMAQKLPLFPNDHPSHSVLVGKIGLC